MSTTILNISIICLSLKYLNKNYNLTSKLSKWIYYELSKYKYKELDLIRSLYKKDFKIIESLIKFNKNKDLLSEYLIKYCSYEENNFSIIKLLIDNGAPINADNDKALREASLNNHIDIVKLLIENGANIHARDDETLRYACSDGYFDLLKLLVDNKADIHANNNEALWRASYFGHFDIVKLLIDNGADTYTEDNYGIIETCKRGHPDIANFLESLI